MPFPADDITIKGAMFDARSDGGGVKVEHAYVKDGRVVLEDGREIRVDLGELVTSKRSKPRLYVEVGDEEGRSIRGQFFRLPLAIKIIGGQVLFGSMLSSPEARF
jgi:hypothetical protein